MNLEEACRAADSAVFAKTGQHLTDVQILILQGALHGQTYTQIAANSHYSVSYIKKLAGPALWHLLSEGLGEEVSKTNFQTALARVAIAHPSHPPPAQQPSTPATRHPIAQLSTVPNPSLFFGREQELDSLAQGIVQDRCPMILVSGLGGIGKTTLLARCARQQQAAFDWIVVQSLGDAPTLANVLENLLLARLGEPGALATPGNGQMQQLMEVLKTHRCLMVLDQMEGILQGGELTGQYLPHCQELGEFLHHLAEGEHESCLVVSGREQPAALLALASDGLPIRHLKLRGLAMEPAKQLLQIKGVNIAQPGVEDLIQMHRGNPLALQIVSTTIQELFDGNVAQLLKQGTIVIGDPLLTLLDEQFERLSEIEKGVIYWLALEPQALTQLRENTRYIVSAPSELLKTLQSLKRRSLLEEEQHPEEGLPQKSDETLFMLQPIVLRYVLKQLITDACIDSLTAIQTQSIQNLGVLRTHVLFTEDHFYQRRYPQTQLLSQALVRHLQMTLGDNRTLHQHLNNLLLSLHEKTTQAIGYATRNVVNLQHMIESQRL
jgi:hypothetical protein